MHWQALPNECFFLVIGHPQVAVSLQSSDHQICRISGQEYGQLVLEHGTETREECCGLVGGIRAFCHDPIDDAVSEQVDAPYALLVRHVRSAVDSVELDRRRTLGR